MKVLVHSPRTVISGLLEQSLRNLGHEVTCSQNAAEVALWDLTRSPLPFPYPPKLPTLAIIAKRETHIMPLFHQGYRGFIRASDNKETFARALWAVWRGEVWADREFLNPIIEAGAAPLLTVREREVFWFVSQGYSNQAVAAQLGMAIEAVERDVTKLFNKLGVGQPNGTNRQRTQDRALAQQTST